MELNERTRGVVRLPLEEYGRTVLGDTLRYIPCKSKCELLIMAGIHGEEPETTFLLSRCLRAFRNPFERTAFILCANPDGMTLGTRGNYNGVDLNRNFPTSNWAPGDVYSRSILEAPRDTVLSSGQVLNLPPELHYTKLPPQLVPEPENRALLQLIEHLKPKSVISMHAPIGCVDAPVNSPLVELLCETFNLPWIPDIGYPTPGSLGSWCRENHLECITLELPRMSLEALFDRYGKNFIEFLSKL